VPKDKLASVVGFDLKMRLQERVYQHVSVLIKRPVEVNLAVYIVDIGINSGKCKQKQRHIPNVGSRNQLPKILVFAMVGEVKN